MHENRSQNEQLGGAYHLLSGWVALFDEEVLCSLDWVKEAKISRCAFKSSSMMADESELLLSNEEVAISELLLRIEDEELRRLALLLRLRWVGLPFFGLSESEALSFCCCCLFQEATLVRRACDTLSRAVTVGISCQRPSLYLRNRPPEAPMQATISLVNVIFSCLLVDASYFGA